MDLQLENKIIIVSGGAKGIGEGIVRVLAQEKQFLLSSEEVLRTIRNLLMIWPKKPDSSCCSCRIDSA
jgi:NADP-dependent 3-hydroxy acid dehydrogenase YdfG